MRTPLLILLTLPLSAFGAELSPQLPPPDTMMDSPTVEAYFEAREVTVEKSVAWNSHKSEEEADSPTLEFTAAEPKTLSVELMFDMFEDRVDHGVHRQQRVVNVSVPFQPRGPLARWWKDRQRSPKLACRSFRIRYHAPSSQQSRELVYENFCLVRYWVGPSRHPGAFEHVQLVPGASQNAPGQ